MEESVDPKTLLEQVETRYREYLLTTFRFRHPQLRAAFAAELGKTRLSMGPYVEATPVFAKGASLRQILQDCLDTSVDEGFLQALFGDRPLYAHQEAAIRAVIEQQRNVVVATGTGSGKTEAFLYPILVELYREFQAGSLSSGVRALILYPMNALVNDQRERLRAIAARLEASGSPFRFTFGQYVGTTPEDEQEARRQRDQLSRPPGELLYRAEMRRDPPHILLTNYSMLEYLLLRPSDSELFDGGRARWWRFLVLDEAHQYRGSRGTEMAMLLRRLKERLRQGGRQEGFTAIATSATIGADGGDLLNVARFASSLFGEPFTERDVLLARQEPWSSSLEGRGPADEREGRVLRVLSEGPQELRRLADLAFPELVPDARIPATTRLLGRLSGGTTEGQPLVNLRYHFFLRSLEGAFVSFTPEPCLTLDRSPAPGGRPRFELALCRACGQEYLVGAEEHGRLGEAQRDPSAPDFGVEFFLPLFQDDEAEGDDSVTPDEEGEAPTDDRILLCVTCARTEPWDGHSRATACGHGMGILLARQAPSRTRRDQLSRCAACGYQAHDPVQEVAHSVDGPHALITMSLLQGLPDERRKVLAFADSRQEAAYFASHLDRFYGDTFARQNILQAVKDLTVSGEGVSLADVVAWLYARDVRLTDLPAASSAATRRRHLWRAAYREFLSLEARRTLEGVGLVRWWVADEIVAAVLSHLPDLPVPWLLPEELPGLLQLLLQTLRRERAVQLVTEAGVTLDWRDLDLPEQRAVGVGRGPDRLAWDGGRRLAFVKKMAIKRNGSPEAATDLLRLLYQAIVDSSLAGRASDALLFRSGAARRANPLWWRVAAVTPGERLYCCDTCGDLSSLSVAEICPRPGCPGRLRPTSLAELPVNVDRDLYQTRLPHALRVEEHTAQLDSDRALAFQHDFQQGLIHVLSSSTTFELGVDLGDLDVIFLRNVPPETFNYTQRTGRAGRRSRVPGVAITYCRRNPHDLYHFQRPTEIIRGLVKPPSISLDNRKILSRHVMATVLSAYFRCHPSRFQNVEAFFGDIAAPEASLSLLSFLKDHRQELEETLRSILPEQAEAMGLFDHSWMQSLTGEDSRLRLVEEELSNDARNLTRLKEEAVRREAYGEAEWASRRLRALRSEDVLSCLSRYAVIPKYGFPVDVVHLDVTPALRRLGEPAGVTLERDLAQALHEFAPSARVVANKLEWVSAGLKQVPERPWPWKSFAYCQRHHAIAIAERREEASVCCPDAERGEFVIPQFGFVSEGKRPMPPSRRPRRLFSSRPYFLSWHRTPLYYQHAGIRVSTASPGTLLVLCTGPRGTGFLLCETCGQEVRNGRREHTDAFGRLCRGRVHRLSLGHILLTDVVALEFAGLPVGTQDETLSVAHSVAQAILQGVATTLDVPPNDLDVTIQPVPMGPPRIILYDTVPGGAGLVACLEDARTLHQSLLAARQRVAGECGCGPLESCYGCLRSFRNQFLHRLLRRGPAEELLRTVLAAWETSGNPLQLGTPCQG